MPIRVTFDDLEPHKRPASADPSFSELWNVTGGEEESMERTVQRWRSQGREFFGGVKRTSVKVGPCKG